MTLILSLVYGAIFLSMGYAVSHIRKGLWGGVLVTLFTMTFILFRLASFLSGTSFTIVAAVIGITWVIGFLTRLTRI